MGQTVDWGRTDYRVALERQLELVRQHSEGSCPDTLILTEHNPVYTIGARPGAEQHLVWLPSMLEKEGIEVIKTNRGGDITYHGPGQIVGYPIIDLSAQHDLHAYLRNLEEVLIRTVASFGLSASRREGMTGIWIGERKIAAIGVAVKKWITYHGFALNVSPDLSHFSGIIPCGITDGTVTSLEKECESSPLPGVVKATLTREFWQVFETKS